jgi:hypothetical protein
VYTKASRDETSRQKISSVYKPVPDRVFPDIYSYECRNVIPHVTTCDVHDTALLFGNQEGLFSADLRAESSESSGTRMQTVVWTRSQPSIRWICARWSL